LLRKPLFATAKRQLPRTLCDNFADASKMDIDKTNTILYCLKLIWD